MASARWCKSAGFAWWCGLDAYVQGERRKCTMSRGGSVKRGWGGGVRKVGERDNESGMPRARRCSSTNFN